MVDVGIGVDVGSEFGVGVELVDVGVEVGFVGRSGGLDRRQEPTSAVRTLYYNDTINHCSVRLVDVDAMVVSALMVVLMLMFIRDTIAVTLSLLSLLL